MALDLLGMEVDRLHNLAVNFGWEKVGESREGNTVEVTYKKAIPQELMTEELGIPPEVGEAT